METVFAITEQKSHIPVIGSSDDGAGAQEGHYEQDEHNANYAVCGAFVESAQPQRGIISGRCYRARHLLLDVSIEKVTHPC